MAEMTGLEWYFAYGSNMSADRMNNRGLHFVARERGVLVDWRLVFDKRSKRDPDDAFANVTEEPGSSVEGVLYRLNPETISILDRIEGAPEHYERMLLPVRRDEGEVLAWVYVATSAWRSTIARPSADYLKHVVAGADLASDGYRSSLVSLLEKALEGRA